MMEKVACEQYFNSKKNFVLLIQMQKGSLKIE